MRRARVLIFLMIGLIFSGLISMIVAVAQGRMLPTLSSAMLLMAAHVVFVVFQTRTHHGVYDAIFEATADEDRATRERDMLLTWIYRGSPMLTQAQRIYRNAAE